MNQMLWKEATYNERLNFIRTLEIGRTKERDTRCNIKILPDCSSVNSYYYSSSDNKVIYLKRSLINSDSSFFRTLEAYHYAVICAEQDYLRHNPEKCKNPLDAAEYEIGCEVRYSDMASFLVSRGQEEARKNSFNETKKMALLNGDRNTLEFKEYEEGFLEWEQLVNKKLDKKFDSNYRKKVEFGNYNTYQQKVLERQKMLEKDNKTIELKLTELQDKYKNQNIPFDTIKEIAQLNQILEQNNVEIHRLITEKTLNPKLGNHFEFYHHKMKLIEQELDILGKMAEIEKGQVGLLTTNPDIMELVHECKLKYVQIEKLDKEIQKKSVELDELIKKSKETKGISKLNPIPDLKKLNLELDIDDLKRQMAKEKAEFKPLRDKVLRVEGLLRKQHTLLLKKNPEYVKLRKAMREIRVLQKAIEERAKGSSVNFQDLSSKADFKTGGSGMKMA